MFEKIKPENYIKLFNIEECLFTSYFELEERKKLYKDALPNIEVIYINGQFYFNKKDLDKYNFSDNKILNNIALIEKRASYFVEFSRRHVKDYSDYSWKKLMEIYKQFCIVWGEYIRVIDICVYSSYHFEKGMLQALKDNNLSQNDFDILTYPLYNTYHQRRFKDMIFLKMGKLSNDKFKKKWNWSRMQIFKYKAIDDKYISDQLNNIKNPEKELYILNKKYKEGKKQYNQLYNNLPKKLKKKADILQKLLYIRDFRIEQVFRGTYNLQKFLRAIAHMLKIPYTELIYMTPIEVMKKEIPKDLKQRMSRYAYCGGKVYVGKDVNTLYGIFNRKSNQDFVKGRGVSKGIVRGKARIVMSVKELSKIKERDIIVCDITNPDYLHALKKVSAIVANIGGFTSHSAVVAREFGIPCVVGTGNATNVFKDGDLVEVDADNGVVKKIAR